MPTANPSNVHALLAGRRRILITCGAVWTVDLVLPQKLPSDLLAPCPCAGLTAYTLESD